MKTIAKIGDYCTGHDGFPPRRAITGSGNVFCNGKGMHCVGDLWETHCDDHECHNGYLVEGSSNIFVGGKQLGRTGDLISCGSRVGLNTLNTFG
jgi:uncharacterized Zn-binding protein involved in type VI secretion